MFRVVLRISGLWVLLLIVFAQIGLGSSAQNITTCSDFTYQEDAQKFYDSGGGRPQDWYGGMDQNNDGVACEHLPAKPPHKKPWFWPGVISVGVVATGAGGILGSRKTKSIKASSLSTALPTSAHAEAGSQHFENAMRATIGNEAQSVPSLPITINVPVTVENHAESSSEANATAQATSSSQSETGCGWEPEGQVFSGSFYNGVNLETERDPATLKRLPYWVYLRSRYWRDVASTAKRRAGYTCESKGCGSRRALHVHHLTYDRGNEKPEHLQVLCAPCHRRVHNRP